MNLKQKYFITTSQNDQVYGSDYGSGALPTSLAEESLREVVGRASFGHIHCVLKPVLR